MSKNAFRLEANIRDIPVSANLPCKLFKSDGDDRIMRKLDDMRLVHPETGEEVYVTTRKTVDTVLLDPDQLSLDDARKYLASGFVWGKVKEVHVVGDYQIIEYHPRACTESGHITRDIDYDKTLFHPCIDWEDAHGSYISMDEALIGVIAYRAEGPNGRAAMYFCRMIGIDSAYDEED